MSRFARQFQAAAAHYDNAAECDAERLSDAAAKRADADWHAADLHDAMYGDWTPGAYAHWFKTPAPVARAKSLAELDAESRAYWGIDA